MKFATNMRFKRVELGSIYESEARCSPGKMLVVLSLGYSRRIRWRLRSESWRLLSQRWRSPRSLPLRASCLVQLFGLLPLGCLRASPPFSPPSVAISPAAIAITSTSSTASSLVSSLLIRSLTSPPGTQTSRVSATCLAPRAAQPPVTTP